MEPHMFRRIFRTPMLAVAFMVALFITVGSVDVKNPLSMPVAVSTVVLTRPRRVLRTPEAAEYLGVATATLEKQRIKGGGPRFIKIGPKLVGYTIEDLDAHIEAGRRTSTSDPGRQQEAATK
jgi:predicted DNA-binding transcriptional regulator AlpA